MGKFLADSFYIEGLETAIAKITQAYISWSLVLGLGWKTIAIGVFLYYTHWISSLNSTAVKALGRQPTFSGFIFVAPFIIPVAILSVLQTKAD